MEFIYAANGLPILSEHDLVLKQYLTRTICLGIKALLKKQNPAWDMVEIESPCLIPRALVNQNYSDDDMWAQAGGADLVLKPETTPASYLYLEHLLSHDQGRPPLVVWQCSKSFRREQDQATKHCRFKEFYQQEFQCVYSADTKNDYQANIIGGLAELLMNCVGLPTRIVLSDRLPDYSLKTLDVEVFNGDKWMEICSCSVRQDFSYAPQFKGKSIKCLCLEIAVGIDRLIYNIGQRHVVFDDLKVTNTLALS